MTQKTRIVKASTDRRATTALVLVAGLGMAGCSSVPDAVNPVEWYRGTTETVGGWFDSDQPVPPEPGRAAGDPGSSASTAYPNLSTVPERPTPSTTPEQREALRQGLVADRANARYTEPAPGRASPPPASAARAPASQPPAPQAPAPQSQAPQAPMPRLPAEPPASLPPVVRNQSAAVAPASAPAPAPAPARQASGDRSGLWPARPAPETPGLRATTTGRVGENPVSRETIASAPEPLPTRVPAPPSNEPAPPRGSVMSGRDTGGATRTILDSSDGAASAPVPRSADQPARTPSVPAAPTAGDQSVIVNEDAIAAAPTMPAFGGQRYLASTIYFGHGSARLTDSERAELVEVARAAVTSGAFVQVIGHASSRTAELGLREHGMANFTMSMRRAETVADALIKAGVPTGRVRIEAISDSQPEFYEVMPSGEAGNRRVEVVLIL